MVVEFQFIVGGDEATLLRFSSETGLWEKKRVNNPLPRWIWRFFDVVSHAGKLCWVDTAAGLLFCDPFVDEPHMEYVPLPRVDLPPEHDGDCRGCGYCGERALASRRYVQLSDGKFRCVDMGSASDGATTKVTMHTLVDPGTKVWTLEYAVSFADIWASESYKAAGLPEKAPVLALVHPKNPDMVYFFVKDQLVGVDLRAKEVLEYETHKMTVPENARVFSYGLLPMELPPALSAGLSKEGAANNSSGRLSNAKMAALVFGWVEAGRVAIATAWAHSYSSSSIAGSPLSNSHQSPNGASVVGDPEPPSPDDSGDLRSWTNRNGNERTFRVSLIPRPLYFVCDVAAATASHVPDPERLIFNNDLGVIAAPGGGRGNYMVVELQTIVGDDEATLLCFSSVTGEWEEKDVANPLPSWIWTFYDIICHDGKLWWVDTAAGLLFCDPFADEPDMKYVPLEDKEDDLQSEDEDDDDGCGYCAERVLATGRIVQLIDGKFRCVEVSSPSHGAAPEVSMRTLVNPETAEWAPEYTKHILGVDVRARKVVEYEARDSSESVLPWKLPPALSAGNAIPQASHFPVNVLVCSTDPIARVSVEQLQIISSIISAFAFNVMA
uniref:DUF1618 domain-containing protein n=1 Tax=Oryza barthii TaxID=65489 RepID=A0A0D3ELL7_9ORYZ